MMTPRMKTLMAPWLLLLSMVLVPLVVQPVQAQQKSGDSSGGATGQKQEAPENSQAKAERQRRMEALEARQSPVVLRDKYMLALSQLLKEQQFSEALPYFDKLDSLPVAKDPLLDYYHGEALYKTGRPEQALQMFYQYIETQGSEAPFYQKSLEMIIKIEGSL